MRKVIFYIFILMILIISCEPDITLTPREYPQGTHKETPEQPKENTYYYEAYIITRGQYNSFISLVPSGLNYNFTQIQGYRQTLLNCYGVFLESGYNVSETDLKTFANQHGIEGTEYTKAKESLDNVGNLIAFFEYKPDPINYMAWFYVEKERK